MPRGDGTGPNGAGCGSGRGLGRQFGNKNGGQGLGQPGGRCSRSGGSEGKGRRNHGYK